MATSLQQGEGVYGRTEAGISISICSDFAILTEVTVMQSEIKDTLKERLTAMEEKLKTTGDKGFKTMWKKVKDKLKDEFESVEDVITAALQRLRSKVDKIFHRVEHHIMHKEVWFLFTDSDYIYSILPP